MSLIVKNIDVIRDLVAKLDTADCGCRICHEHLDDEELNEFLEDMDSIEGKGFERYKNALDEGRIVRATGTLEQEKKLQPDRIVTWWIVKEHGQYIGFRADDDQNQTSIENEDELDTIFALYNTDLPQPEKIPRVVEEIRDNL